MFIYFIRGNLPWRELRASPDPPPNTNCTPSQGHLCQFYNLAPAAWDVIPNEELPIFFVFHILYRYGRTPEFDDLPDYESPLRVHGYRI